MLTEALDNSKSRDSVNSLIEGLSVITPDQTKFLENEPRANWLKLFRSAGGLCALKSAWF